MTMKHLLYLSVAGVVALIFASHLTRLSHAQNAPGSAPGTALTTNSSVVIVTGNTFQTILAASSNRESLTIQNNNTTDSCWVFVGSGTPTKAKSLLLDTTHGSAYGRYFPFVPSDVIQATCASNGDTLYVDTQ